MLASVHPQADVALLYRNISAGYQALYGNAFTESAAPTNEKGLYAGVSVRPHPAWRLQAYVDHFTFPWLRYRAGAPGSGKEYMLQLTHTWGKKLEAYLRYRSETKPLNSSGGAIASPVPVQRQGVRIHAAYRLSPQLYMRGRTELAWYSGTKKEKSFLTYAEGIYKPDRK